MEIPNVEMIGSSLRCCYLTPADNNRGVDHEITVDLNSEVHLPHPWQQFLNLQTGEIYYVNETDGAKITHNPRRCSLFNSDSEPVSGIDDDDQQEVETNNSEESSDGSNKFTSSSSSSSSKSSVISTTSSTTSTASSSVSTSKDRREIGSDVDDVLVLVGCKVCFTLSMVTRPATECAKCGSAAFRRF